MPRVLSPDERALWRRVTADVRGRKLAEVDAETVVSAPLKPTPKPAPRPRIDLPPSALRPQIARALPQTATLDGKWDRELRTGAVVPDRVIDLHGCTLAEAHGRVLNALDSAVAAGDRLVVIVTGRAPASDTTRIDRPLRGIIRASIGDWLRASSLSSRIAAIRPAHPRHGGAGALYVVLRRFDRR